MASAMSSEQVQRSDGDESLLEMVQEGKGRRRQSGMVKGTEKWGSTGGGHGSRGTALNLAVTQFCLYNEQIYHF